MDMNLSKHSGPGVADDLLNVEFDQDFGAWQAWG